MPKINLAGVTLVKAFEGCRLEAYQDAGGVWTIGYGHTGDDVTPGKTITQGEANALLAKDLAAFEQGVNGLCAVPLNSNQFSALVSFAYNVGLGALGGSTLMHLVNARHFAEAAQQFSHWVYAGGVVLPGLVRRRAAEAALFVKPC